MLLHERGREKDIIDQSVLGELVNQQKTARFQQEYIVLPKLMLVERCACLYVLPQYLNNYKEQAEAEEVSGNIEQIPDDKLYFYDE